MGFARLAVYSDNKTDTHLRIGGRVRSGAEEIKSSTSDQSVETNMRWYNDRLMICSSNEKDRLHDTENN